MFSSKDHTNKKEEKQGKKKDSDSRVYTPKENQKLTQKPVCQQCKALFKPHERKKRIVNEIQMKFL